MFYKKAEPMVKLSNQVRTTTDYFMFKSIDGNRKKNLMHINRLRKSMQENYLFTAIIVNENYEIIDGQHRFDIIEELKMPLNYIVCRGYGLNEVHILNQNSKTWNCDDYLTGYCNLGYAEYIKYAAFKKKYNLGHNEALSLLTGVKGKQAILIFYNGNFKIKSIEKAESIMNKVLMIDPYYKGTRRRSFIYAMMSLCENGNFDFSEFIHKLNLQPTALQDCTSVANYRDLIEEIYNYRRHDKINLRF